MTTHSVRQSSVGQNRSSSAGSQYTEERQVPEKNFQDETDNVLKEQIQKKEREQKSLQMVAQGRALTSDAFAQKRQQGGRGGYVHSTSSMKQRRTPQAVKGRKGQKGKGKKGKSHKGGGHSKRGGSRPVALRTMRTIIPDRVTVELPFLYQSIAANAGLAYASVRFQTNGCWDPDPTLGGNSFLGLSEWSGLYNYYRPLSVSYELTVANQEAFPMAVYVYHLNIDPGGVVGTAGGIYSEQQFGKRTMLAPLTGGKSVHTFRGRVPFAQLLGLKGDLMNDDNYRGGTGGSVVGFNPADGFWMGFNSEANVVQTAAGMLYTIVLRVVVEIYDRVALI